MIPKDSISKKSALENEYVLTFRFQSGADKESFHDLVGGSVALKAWEAV